MDKGFFKEEKIVFKIILTFNLKNMNKTWIKLSGLLLAVFLLAGAGCAEMIGMSYKDAPADDASQAEVVVDGTDEGVSEDGDGAVIEASLEGKWVSFDDEYSTIEFIDGLKLDYYEGEKVFEEPYELIGNTLTVTTDDDTMTYTVVELTEDALELTYLGPGNTLKYLRLTE